MTALTTRQGAALLDLTLDAVEKGYERAFAIRCLDAGLRTTNDPYEVLQEAWRFCRWGLDQLPGDPLTNQAGILLGDLELSLALNPAPVICAVCDRVVSVGDPVDLGPLRHRGCR